MHLRSRLQALEMVILKLNSQSNVVIIFQAFLQQREQGGPSTFTWVLIQNSSLPLPPPLPLSLGDFGLFLDSDLFSPLRFPTLSPIPENSEDRDITPFPKENSRNILSWPHIAGTNRLTFPGDRFEMTKQYKNVCYGRSFKNQCHDPVLRPVCGRSSFCPWLLNELLTELDTGDAAANEKEGLPVPRRLRCGLTRRTEGYLLLVL